MRRIPGGIKRRLLPIWNGGHRLAWRAGEYLDAVKSRRFERCAVCGRFAPMLYRRWVIPPRLEQLWGLSPRVAEALARRESCDCARCGAQLRARRLALALLETFPVGDPPRPARSVADWVRTPDARALRVAEVNRIEGLHAVLSRLPGVASSDFQPGTPPGSIVGGSRSEDLTRLSYPDGAFDVVLTSETLEHVPDVAAALGEIRRVLVSGGWHLGTIPVLPGVPTTYPRAVLNPDGTVTHLGPAICHPGGDVGYPVFTEFGADLPDILRAAGFAVSVAFGPTTEDDLTQVYACRKIDAPT